MKLDEVLAVMGKPISDAAVFRALLEDVPAEVWRDAQARALTHTLLRALETPYHRARVDIDPEGVARDPFAAVLAFPPLRKQDYWDHRAEMSFPEVPAEYVFYTSGTEGGIATDQPWDRFTFEKSFGESSALALVSAGARPGDRLLLGTPLHGALGEAFRYAASALGLVVGTDAKSFSDPDSFREEVLPFVRGGVDFVVAAPSVAVLLAHRLRDAGVDPRSLGVRGIISGIGTFLGDQHRDFFVEAFDPEIIHEQGGKNEILHAPGGRRHCKTNPSAICRPGFLHVLPWAAHVVAASAEKLAHGICEPIGHEKEGVLLMTRLSAGRDGCVAYVNDAGDFGMTLDFGGLGSPICPCGNTMPAFRFMGRAGRPVMNKLGDTIFTEELVRALSIAARDVGLDNAAAVGLRIQALLVRDADPRAPDTLFWIVGAELRAFASHADTIVAAARRWLRVYPKYKVYAGPLAKVMRFGGFVVVDSAALPHAGRDKPQYPLSVDLSAKRGEPHAAALDAHLRGTLRASVLARGLDEEDPAR